jgi:hypothetical protein
MPVRKLTSLLVEQRVARVQRHHDLLERRVARAFPDAVDGDLRLARAGADAGQRVGRSEAEIVVAVHRDDGLPDVRGTCFMMPAISAPNSSGTV